MSDRIWWQGPREVLALVAYSLSCVAFIALAATCATAPYPDTTPSLAKPNPIEPFPVTVSEADLLTKVVLEVAAAWDPQGGPPDEQEISAACQRLASYDFDMEKVPDTPERDKTIDVAILSMRFGVSGRFQAETEGWVSSSNLAAGWCQHFSESDQDPVMTQEAESEPYLITSEQAAVITQAITEVVTQWFPGSSPVDEREISEACRRLPLYASGMETLPEYPDRDRAVDVAILAVVLQEDEPSQTAAETSPSSSDLMAGLCDYLN